MVPSTRDETVEAASSDAYDDLVVATMTEDLPHIYTPAPLLASSRYNRQMLIPAISVPGQEKILQAKVLIIGLGGLGSPAALYLAGAGVGVLGLLDDDFVEATNLHRQIVHREGSVQEGLTKVQSALRSCRELNSEIEITPHSVRLDVSSRQAADKIFAIIGDYEIILDCTDNPATRYLINDLCVVLGKTLVSGAAQRLEGQLTVLNYSISSTEDRGPCYRCVFPTPPSPEMVKGCGEIGILGPVVGTIGTLMATEALRLIVKTGNDMRKPTMLLYNAWPSDPRSMFRSIGLKGKRPDCVACGDPKAINASGRAIVTKESITNGTMDYITFCGISGPVNLLRGDQRISAIEFLNAMSGNSHLTTTDKQRGLDRAITIDVREEFEIEMGTKLNSSVNIPLSRFMKQKSIPDELLALVHSDSYDSVLFVCQRGNDSQLAAKKLLDWQHGEKQKGLALHMYKFIGDVVGGLSAVEKG